MKKKKKNTFAGLVVRPVAECELDQWKTYLRKYHYLGYKCIPGKSLRYVALLDKEWVALIGWGSPALKCGVRDRYIGWDVETKYKRLKYVVNNVRFLVLPWVNQKNLASKVLSVNLKRLSDDFESAYGHQVFLAETFVDESKYMGTCYKASNWQHIGYSRGYSKCNKRYYKNGQRKGVYVYALEKRAKALLCSDFLPYSFHSVQIRRLMNKMLSQEFTFPVEGLVDEIKKITDPRKPRGIRHRLETVLGLSVCAVIFGARSYLALADWAKGLNKSHLERFSSIRDTPPSEPTFRRILQSINAEEFDQKIGQWLLRQRVFMDNEVAIAIDGKTLRGSRDKAGDNKAIHLLGAVIHKEGIIIAQEQVDEKSNEIKHVKPLLNDLPLQGAVITADALHTQKNTAQYIVDEKKADYVFTVKGNQQTLLQDIKDLDLKKIYR